LFTGVSGAVGAFYFLAKQMIGDDVFPLDDVGLPFYFNVISDAMNFLAGVILSVRVRHRVQQADYERVD
jgi:hypothetical protein